MIVQVASSIGTRILRASVRADEDSFQVVCEQDSDGRWIADYALRPDGERVPLPSCFNLSADALQALKDEQGKWDAYVQGV